MKLNFHELSLTNGIQMSINTDLFLFHSWKGFSNLTRVMVSVENSFGRYLNILVIISASIKIAHKNFEIDLFYRPAVYTWIIERKERTNRRRWGEVMQGRR